MGGREEVFKKAVNRQSKVVISFAKSIKQGTNSESTQKAYEK